MNKSVISNASPLTVGRDQLARQAPTYRARKLPSSDGSRVPTIAKAGLRKRRYLLYKQPVRRIGQIIQTTRERRVASKKNLSVAYSENVLIRRRARSKAWFRTASHSVPGDPSMRAPNERRM